MKNVLILVLALSFTACEYDPPPEILASIPALGTVTGDTTGDVVITFSEAVKRESVEATLFRRKLDENGELLPRCQAGETEGCLEPLAGPCTVKEDCQGGTLVLSTDFTRLTLNPDKDFAPGEYQLRLAAGLEDLSGNATGVPIDLFFYVSPLGTIGPTDFQPGVFMTWLDLDEPFYFPIEVYWDIHVDPDEGWIYGGGCDGDPTNPDGERILDHEFWAPNPYLETEGFKLIFNGLVQNAQVEDEDGNLQDGYVMATEPFYIYCAQPQVEVYDGMISVTILYDEELGREVIKGTLRSDETYIFDTPAHSHPYEASGAMWGYRLRPDEVGTNQIWEDCADLVTVTRP